MRTARRIVTATALAAGALALFASAASAATWS